MICCIKCYSVDDDYTAHEQPTGWWWVLLPEMPNRKVFFCVKCAADVSAAYRKAWHELAINMREGRDGKRNLSTSRGKFSVVRCDLSDVYRIARQFLPFKG